MKPKFEYPGYALTERNEQFKLMLAWADYHANYREHEDTIKQIGLEVILAMARSAVVPDQNADICKELLYREVPGMNGHLADIESAIKNMRGWQVTWTEPGSNPNEPLDARTQQGWIVDGSVSLLAPHLQQGSIVWMHVSNRIHDEVGTLVDMSTMQEINFKHV